MLHIYLVKWRMAITGSLAFVDTQMKGMAQWLFGPERFFNSGIQYTLAFLCIALAAIYFGYRYNAASGMLVATIAGVGFMLCLESAIVMPDFVLSYHTVLLFAVFFVNLVLAQFLASAVFQLLTGETYLRKRSSLIKLAQTKANSVSDAG
jgi:hypothetical protein